MKYNELEKKIGEVFEGFQLEVVKTEFIAADNYNLVKYGLEVENGNFTEVTISGVVKEKMT